MDVLRRHARKPDLPVWFVSFGDGRGWAGQTARAITSARFINMGVTYSSDGKYESSEDVLQPIAAAAPVMPITSPLPVLASRSPGGTDRTSDQDAIVDRPAAGLPRHSAL